jgi:two-component system, chemotaxis family, sensor kinase Cph1
MKIKDIVNRDIVNLTNCEQEPIHIPGSIQPHGFLIALRNESFIIEFCSGNTDIYLGISHRNILGKAFADIFGNSDSSSLKTFVATPHSLSVSLFPLKFNSRNFLCTIHKSDELFILEAEPASESLQQLADVYSQTRRFLSYMEADNTLQELCQRVAENTREITGYDRVMIYRFDGQYNGEVYAESVRDDLEPFLGLHYPHTDIPPQARELYLRNLVRLIVDINYTPVPIYTIDDKEEKNLDLSLSLLRSTSPIHVQYLQNMGVGATLTISLVHKEKLWGLIACHHYSAKNITPELKLAAQLQGHFITSQIDTRQLNEEFEVSRRCNQALERMVSVVYPVSHESFKHVVNDPNLLQLCNAAGVAIVLDGKIYTGGKVPPGETINILLRELREMVQGPEYSTNQLPSKLPNVSVDCSRAAGIILHSLAPDLSTCIVWFRPETVTEVHWGGDPAKAIIKDKNGLSPRNSFERWKETVKCQSKPWRQSELNAAAQYAHTLQKQVNLLLISEEERRYRELSELLRQTNAELENINWISTHDLQEPLRKIQLFASRLLEDTESYQLTDSRPLVEKINSSASRMQVLLKDILKYTRVKNTSAVLEKVALNEIIKEILPELDEAINRKKAQLIVDPLPTIDGIPFLLKQVFANLIFNSLKFTVPDRAPVIHIKGLGRRNVEVAGDNRVYEVISCQDNGIGFHSKHEENIFNVFTRLHSYTEFEGSGIGLALCKKIMQTHNGFVHAKGVPGEGATFLLYFPVETIS